MPIGGPAQLLLETSNRLAGVGTNDSVRCAWIEALLSQALLQFKTLRAAQWLLSPWPVGLHLTAPVKALRQQPYGQGVGCRVVVTQDGAEIIQDQECRPTVTGR